MLKNKKTLTDKFYDSVAIMCIIVFFGSIILKIWLPDEVQYILNRLWLTSLTTFFFIYIIYAFTMQKFSNDII